MSLSAQPTALISAPAVNPPPTSGTSWFALVVLTLLVVLVAVVVWFYKRRLNPIGGDQAIRVLGAQPVGAREQIVVARVYGRVLVLGHTPAQLNLLCELDPDEVPDVPDMPAGADFSQLISRFVRKEPSR